MINEVPYFFSFAIQMHWTKGKHTTLVGWGVTKEGIAATATRCQNRRCGKVEGEHDIF